MSRQLSPSVARLSRLHRSPTSDWPESPQNIAEAPFELFKAKLTDVGEARKVVRASKMAVQEAARKETTAVRDTSRAEKAAVQDAAREKQKGVAAADQDCRKATHTAFLDGKKSEQAAALAHFSKFYDSVVGLAVGSVDRSRTAADLVQKSSAAVAALYTGILALVFSVTDNPLPARGALTPFFLGLAVVLSTAFIAYLGRPGESTPGPAAALTVEGKGYAQLNTLIEMTTKLAVRRSGALRASVVALGVGLAFIVMPFISVTAPPAPSDVQSSTVNPAPSWPPQPTGGTAALNRIRYQAEVDEVAAARKEASKTVATREYDVEVLVGGLLIGIAVVIVVTLLVRPHARRPRLGGDGFRGWLKRTFERAAGKLTPSREAQIPVTIRLTEAELAVLGTSPTGSPQETVESWVKSTAESERRLRNEAQAKTKRLQGSTHSGSEGDGARLRSKFNVPHDLVSPATEQRSDAGEDS